MTIGNSGVLIIIGEGNSVELLQNKRYENVVGHRRNGGQSMITCFAVGVSKERNCQAIA